MSYSVGSVGLMPTEVLNDTTIRTSRLTLSRPLWSDISAIHAICSDPASWAHLPSGRHQTREQTEQLVARWILGWETEGLDVAVVRRRGSVEVLGYVGCSVRDDKLWNLSYRLAPSAQGMGYAREAAQAAIDQATRIRPELPVTAYLLEHNLASASVARDLGLALIDSGPDAADPRPGSVRLVFSDRPLRKDERRTVMG